MKPHLLAALLVPALASAASVAAVATGGLAVKLAPADVAQATKTTETLVGGLVAAVGAISDATPPGSTPADVAANSAAVTLLLPPGNGSYGLIDATGFPLDPANLPKGSFEVGGLLELLGGAPIVQSVEGGSLRTMVPLTSDMHPNCMVCHADYGMLPAGTVVGAAAVRVKL